MGTEKDKNPYVIYLTRSNMIIGGDVLKDLITVEFAEDVFVDLEFPNIKSFNNQILTAVEQFNLKPNRVIFVLNQAVYFAQEFAAAAEEEIKVYLSFVPFDEVISKRFPNASGQLLTVVSKDLIDPLVDVFTHHGFEVMGIIPDSALGETLLTPEQFAPQVIETISKTWETLEPFTFYSPPKVQEGMTSIRDSEGHIFSPRLIGMIVFFVVLIGILIAVLVMNGYIGAPKKPAVVSPPAQNAEVVVPTVTPENVVEASASAEENASSSAGVALKIQKTIQIEVLNGSGTAGQADLIKSALNKDGFAQVKTGNSTSVGLKTLILYKPTVTTDSIQVISSTLKDLGIENSAQENPGLDNTDVRIMTGKQP